MVSLDATSILAAAAALLAGAAVFVAWRALRQGAPARLVERYGELQQEWLQFEERANRTLRQLQSEGADVVEQLERLEQRREESVAEIERKRAQAAAAASRAQRAGAPGYGPATANASDEASLRERARQMGFNV